MKKGINIFAIIAIVLGVIAVAVVLAIFLRKPANSGGTGNVGQDFMGYTALHLETIDQFRDYAKQGEYECHLGDDESGGSIYNVPVLGQNAVVTYYFDEQGNTIDFEAFYYLNADIINLDDIKFQEVSLDEMADLAKETVSRFGMMFGCNSVADIYLTNADGTFTLVEDNASFQSLVDGLSYLTFSIRDEQGYFWELTIYANEGLISANLRKFFNMEETADYIANISLYEEE